MSTNIHRFPQSLYRMLVYPVPCFSCNLEVVYSTLLFFSSSELNFLRFFFCGNKVSSLSLLCSRCFGAKHHNVTFCPFIALSVCQLRSIWSVCYHLSGNLLNNLGQLKLKLLQTASSTLIASRVVLKWLLW